MVVAARYNIIHISKEKMTVLIPYLELLLLAFAYILPVGGSHHSLNMPGRVGVWGWVSVTVLKVV